MNDREVTDPKDETLDDRNVLGEKVDEDDGDKDDEDGEDEDED